MCLPRYRRLRCVQRAGLLQSFAHFTQQRRHRLCPVHGRHSSDEAARTRRKHLRMLDLDEESDWDDIQFAYKKLVKEHHPDRHPPSRRKQKEKRMGKINAAYTWLKKNYEEAA